MRIDNIHIEGFRGINVLDLELNPTFNLIVGNNGSGKTAILEALTVGMSAYFLGMPGIPSRNIRDEDIRYFKTPEGSYEFAPKTLVRIDKGFVKHLNEVVVDGRSFNEIDWYKERNGIAGRTLHGRKSLIKILSQEINAAIGDSSRTTAINLPVLAYYSTARLWKEGRGNESDEDDDSVTRSLPSRYRGYKDALEIKSTFKIMLEWFKGKYSDMRITGQSTVQMDCVKKVILANVPDAIDMRWVFDSDKINTLYISFQNGTETPFSYLSDGYRNLLAIFADLAYRCVTLNPHLGVDANLNTEGMVSIDELDLHLHPKWQKTIVKQLKDTFPKIQFVATTHSPFIIQEMEEGQLYKINETGEIAIGGADEYSLEDVAEYIQKVEDPAWSIHKKKMYDAAKEYFELLERLTSDMPSEELDRTRERLNILGRAYSDNVAYTAFLEQKRFLAEQNLTQ